MANVTIEQLKLAQQRFLDTAEQFIDLYQAIAEQRDIAEDEGTWSKSFDRFMSGKTSLRLEMANMRVEQLKLAWRNANQL
ncbi:MAG: hypothetical protein WCJ35_20920 [Planctomycetota bacterium]